MTGVQAGRPRFLAGLIAVAALGAALLGPSASEADAKPVWLCKPGSADNPCDVGLKTTELSPSGDPIGVVKPKKAKHPKVDCFYVYPTVSDQTTPNANLNIDPEERSIALYQAARYSRDCRVFAPMYRQLTLSAIGGTPTEEQRQIAYSSVLDAWKTYLKRYNRGRGVVLIGHSQGTFVLRELIGQEIDSKRKLRKRLVSALLLGGNVTVKAGDEVGGDFQHVKACHSKRQLRCVVAFSTFNAPVPPDALFGRTTEPGLQVLCANPASLGGGSGQLDSIYPTAPFAPGTTIGLATGLVGLPRPAVSTPWIEAKAYTGECSSANNANALQITGLPGAPKLNAVPDATWGLHLTDGNIGLGNLSDLVRKQAKVFVKKRK
jgi:Protein of unknown function (DUF3089)